MAMKKRDTLLSYLEDYYDRNCETALVWRRGLRMVRWSYRKVWEVAVEWSEELAARQISKSDRVLFYAENSPDWVAAFFGCLLRGAVVVPFDVQSAPDFVLRVQQQVEAKLLLVGTVKDRVPDLVGIPILSIEN